MEDVSSSALLRDSCGGSLEERVRLLGVEIMQMELIVGAAKALLKG
jgi:hypothetical protein